MAYRIADELKGYEVDRAAGELPSCLPAQLRSLLAERVFVTPAQRASAAELQSHPYFAALDWGELMARAGPVL